MPKPRRQRSEKRVVPTRKRTSVLLYRLSERTCQGLRCSLRQAARDAKAKCQVAASVHCGTAHPAPGSIWLVRALLKDSHRSASDIAQFNPTDTCYASRTDRIVRHYRFVVTKITIGEPEHEAVADSVQRGAIRLGHAGGRGGTQEGETRRGWAGEERKG